MSVLVYIENTVGELKKSAYEAASYAKDLADQLNTDVVALSIGNVGKETLQKLGNYGIPKVLHTNTEKLSTFVNQAYASVIAVAAQQEKASVVIISNTFSGKALAPRVAAKLQAGLISGAITLPVIQGDSLEVKRTAFSNKAIASVRVQSPIKLLTINPNVYAAKESPVSSQIVDYLPELAETDFGIVVKEIVRATD
ncbi:MAG TPA: electron transfer flavoprotein subunit alpha/FixB family protein, partial [Sphingobacterium sp.]|nr:electron transfer flavoprotein subunit alpha/FixB family protein [Sphingobacterium sp.]